MAQSVADILGCPLDYAESLLEASGGDPSLAIELGLGGGIGGGDGAGAGGDDTMMMMANNDAAVPVFSPPYGHYTRIWPEAAPLPDAWKNQRLDDFVTPTTTTTSTSSALVGIVQPLNGPCGVLAVVQAEMWLHQQNTTTTTTSSPEECLTTAITNILSRILQQKQPPHTEVVTMADGSTLSLQEASKQIRTTTALVEAAATTLGTDLLPAAATLVEGPHWLCSADLMCLLLRGSIQAGNFGAWDPMTKQKTPFYPNNNNNNNKNKIGVLSMMEIDQNIPVADDLKFDKTVWVLHTGDHFLTMSQKNNTNDDKAKTVVLEIFDGLKPNGPITKTFVVSGDTSLAEPAPEIHVESFRKKRTGQPDDIVQANKTDNSNYKKWIFEVVPAIDDPDVQGPLDDDPNEPIYDFQTMPIPEQNWRCATCYANRFKTMNFGTNEAGSTNCSVCNMPQRQAMWSLWLSYDKLSPRMKRRARNMYAPKLELILATLYPKADINEE